MNYFSRWRKWLRSRGALKPKPKPKTKNHGNFKSGRWVYCRQWYSFRRRHPESYCARTQHGKLVSGQYTDLERVVRTLGRQCIPTNDVGDVWDSYLRDYKRGRRWRGDCEDYAITGVDVMLSDGYVSPANCAIHKVDQHGGHIRNHMVASVKMEGETYLIDVLHEGKVTRIEDCKYTFIDHMRVNMPGRWRKTVM